MENQNVEQLIAQLKDKDIDVRQKAVESLRRAGAPAVEPLLIELLVARLDSEILVKIGAPTVEALIAALEDAKNTSLDAQVAIVKILGMIGDERAVESLLNLATMHLDPYETYYLDGLKMAAADALDKIRKAN